MKTKMIYQMNSLKMSMNMEVETLKTSPLEPLYLLEDLE